VKTIIEQICLDANQIKNRMKSIIERNIFNEHLMQLLLSFIEPKKNFSLAESAVLHYVIFDGENQETAVNLGAAIEILTLTSDIIDDLEDEDNRDAPWMKIDRSLALSAAFSLYTAGLQSINSISTNPLVIKYVLKYIQDAMQGQHDDLINKPKTEDECLEVIKLKCGSLFALANVTGTLLATGEFNKSVESYSYYKGIFEQISGDYHAIFKDNTSDILKDKHTLINLYLKRLFNKSSQELLCIFSDQKLYSQLRLNKKEFIQKLYDSGASQYVSVLYQLYMHKCETEVENLNLDIKKIKIIKKHLLNNKNNKKDDEDAEFNKLFFELS